MQTEAAERRGQRSRSRRGESGQGRAEARGTKPRAAVHSARSSEEETARLKEIPAIRQQKENQAGERGRRAEREGVEDEERDRAAERDRSRGDGGRRREREARSRRAASEGGEEGEQSERLRWRVHQLEKEKLGLTSSHNQELCRLQAELTRLRSSVERGEAQRVELQYQLTVSRRDADRASELSRDKRTLTERAAELQQTVQELQKALDITRQAREEDQHALQQEVEERDRLIQSFSSENQRLHQLLQDHEEALQESERRMVEVQQEREKEAEVNRRQANELKYLTEREERSRRDRELSDQRVKSLESSVEAERAAHLESKFNSEIIQLRVRDLEAALASERSGQQEAQCSLELLRAQFREVERAYSLERERGDGTERALQRLQKEYDQCKSDLSVALETEKKTSSDLSERLEEEKRRHADTHTLLEKAAQRQSGAEEAFVNCVDQIRETLQQHSTPGTSPGAKDHENRSQSAEVLQLLKTTLCTYRHTLEKTDKQVQDLLFASERLQEENQTLRQLTSEQSQQVEESLQAAIKLGEEVTRLRQESSDWSTQSRVLRAELEKEREERETQREERERERETEREEREREREEKTAEVQKITEHYQKESQARLSFLYCVYQRLLAGCVLLNEPQSILGNFSWKELCDVINEQVDQLTSDLRKANNNIAHLQSVCEKKSACVRELQRSQECVLSRLEESVRRREEAWSSQHVHTVTQLQNELQACRSQCDSLRDHASSLELRCSSLTSDLSRLQGLLSRSRREAASFLSACALLAGALKHTRLCLQTLSKQKALLCRRLAEREVLEEEVRTLARALGGEEDEEEEEAKRSRRRAVRRRWRRSVCVVLAVRRWRALAKQTTVLFRLERGGGVPAVCVCGESATATQKGEGLPSTDKDGDDEGACARWLLSKCLASTILSSVADLQRALAHTGSSPPDVMSAARSGLSRLLDHLLDQSDAASSMSPCRVDTLSGRLGLGLSRRSPPQPHMKALVSALQQHFLLFSQRLHSAEVERRSLRLEVTNLKRGLRQERAETCRTVPAERFSSVCVELRQALSREQEAQTLIQEQTKQLHALQLQVNTHTAEHTNTQHTLRQTTQSLSETRQEVSRKERSLRILGKHLSVVQRERKQLEERLQRVEDELRDATRRKDCLISAMKAAETSYKELRESLVQSRHSLSAQPHPLPLPREHLELSGAESIIGAPEVAACQSLLSTFSQLYHTCSSRIDWLEQEVSAHRCHVTALRSELQDACLRDNLAYLPVAEFPETFPIADVETPRPVPLSDLSKEPSVSLRTAPSQTNPAPSSPLSKTPRVKTKEKKAVKKNRGGKVRR
ncbi:coiled-coil domain-containing protein 171-like [Micropterus salmoides]|uniref:coiled-coil domain-containing protein 171-like n=1 Tax=Micropterus salmoides TaxID=27706 RepID=UPI0018EC27FF|nr:coiled-coil domain-containing protein 171-like [Micropterus salmoides]